ncbi:hypothetical protein DB88DRAFT_529578 [Papiliotrema laurentii]|uniref:Uncharacterized protein n=1 Tax=Papiliotrema laurentii TaxID=5418 RepID=A0AAD9CVP1_PAPLA|nr:hypothetical protein DB88DRAFT_529578 [Papiliotrema laurentii]
MSSQSGETTPVPRTVGEEEAFNAWKQSICDRYAVVEREATHTQGDSIPREAVVSRDTAHAAQVQEENNHFGSAKDERDWLLKFGADWFKAGGSVGSLPDNVKDARELSAIVVNEAISVLRIMLTPEAGDFAEEGLADSLSEYLGWGPSSAKGPIFLPISAHTDLPVDVLPEDPKTPYCSTYTATIDFSHWSLSVKSRPNGDQIASEVTCKAKTEFGMQKLGELIAKTCLE